MGSSPIASTRKTNIILHCKNVKMLYNVDTAQSRPSGYLAQLGEHLFDVQKVSGSSPLVSTIFYRNAFVVQWQNTSFPSWLCGFDSRRVLHSPLVIQLDRMSDFESEGCGFESYRAGHFFIPKFKIFLQFHCKKKNIDIFFYTA